MLDGRELAIVFAKDRRKSSDEMRAHTRSDSRDRGARRDRKDGSRSRSRERGRDDNAVRIIKTLF